MNQKIIQALKQLGGSGTRQQIYRITKIPLYTLDRLLRTMCKRGEILKEFVITGVHYAGGNNRNFVYKLIEEVGTY